MASRAGRGSGPKTCCRAGVSSRRRASQWADLKKLGWKFVGPTTAYAFMQAMGLVNDHAQQCVIRSRVQLARKAFSRPG